MHPILVSLKEKGGSATSSETADDVIERLAISDQELEVTLKSGQTRVYNQIHWARMYLVKAGFIDSSSRGVWTLTETDSTRTSQHSTRTKHSNRFRPI